MDDLRYDRLARTLTDHVSRRVLGSGVLGALGLAALSQDGIAKKKKKKCKGGLTRCKIKKGKKTKTLCVDAQTDPANCGTCGNVCPTGARCTGGVCQPVPCSPATCSGVCCEGTCCPAGQRCQDGACAEVICPEGQRDCGNGCETRECCTANDCAGAQCRSGTCDPHLSDESAAFVRQQITAFMDDYNMPGAVLGLLHEGRLVFAQGYGIADPASGTPVRIDHLFRIASLSKSITSVTIFRLIEAGLLSLNDTVFGAGGILGTTYGTPPYGPNITQITIQHLLEHTSGWAPEIDPTFGQMQLSQAQLIDRFLDNEPLSYAPGTTFFYLNMGYMILGRVIERVTGQGYATVVSQRTLTPSGVTDMHIAGDTLAQRRPNEVVYVPQAQWSPYTFRISRMDAQGGWIASVVDLARILTRIDGLPNWPDILTPSSVATMATETTARTPQGERPYYGKGWGANQYGVLWHFGGTQGTQSSFLITREGSGWVVLFNSRDDHRIEQSVDDLNETLWTILEGIDDWPDIDLLVETLGRERASARNGSRRRQRKGRTRRRSRTRRQGTGFAGVA